MDSNDTQTGMFARFKSGFKKTSTQLTSLFTGNYIEDSLWDELLDRMILADIGPELSERLLENVRLQRSALKTPQTLMEELKKQAVLLFPKARAASNESTPWVILVIGVNGAGKTTTIAKLSQLYKKAGKSVIVGAADTFRAAAIEQLQEWTDKLDIPLIRQQEGSDPASVAYDSVIAAKSRKADIVIIDTAGRLHTKHNLMEELKKIYRVTGKAEAGAPHEVLLVLDGTAGQNALSQARAFNEIIPVTALAITKLDGTAKGGIVMRIADEMKLPVKYVGLGEKAEDLIPFEPAAYVDAIFNV